MVPKETKIDLINRNPAQDLPAPPSSPGKEGPKPAAETEETEKRKSKKLIFILGLTGLFVLAGGVGTAGYLGYLPIPGLSAPSRTLEPQTQRVEMGEILKFSPLIINLNEASGRHYLKTTLVLELENKKWAEEIQSRMPMFTDSLILIVSEKTLEDIKSPEFKDRLRQEFLDRFNEHLKGTGVRQVYFDEFLFQ